jgi:rhodanese-related sulfurtransferase
MKDSLIIDVRTEHEFIDKHIKGSLLIDINQPTQFIDEVNSLDKNKNYFIYLLFSINYFFRPTNN